jgi:single-strand DNA-binding protein
MIISGVGRLGRDGELRYTPSGVAVVNLALAFNYGQKQNDGNRRSQWVECALWGKQAESLVQYLKKGNQVSVTAADPHIDFFQRDDSTQGTKLVANIINIELVGSKKDEAEDRAGSQQATPGPEHYHATHSQQSGGQSRQQAGAAQNNSMPAPNHDNFDEFDQDIPF